MEIDGPKNIIETAHRECVSLATRVNELVRGAKVRIPVTSPRFKRTTLPGHEFVILRVDIFDRRRPIQLAEPDAPNMWFESCALEDVEFIA